jgi:tRNA-guanine family transglycosylase
MSTSKHGVEYANAVSIDIQIDRSLLRKPQPYSQYCLVRRLTTCQTTKARAATLILPHGPVSLPLFMPVATQASLKGLTPQQLEETGCRLCLNNTYHLGLKPGQDVLKSVGGAHKLQGWKHNILTDSGGSESFKSSKNAAEILISS